MRAAMPEGDTLEKIATALDGRLRAAPVDDLQLRGRPLRRLRGRSVTGVEARGKHLLIHLDDGSCLQSHLGMQGSWHRYRIGERWRKRPARASLVLRCGEQVYVCFNAREARWHPGASSLRDSAAGCLGPDLLAAATRAETIPARARRLLPPDELLVDMLLDQRVAAGIGNVYKSELMFVHRLAPEHTLDAVDNAMLEAVYASAMQLLARNLHGGRRRTRFDNQRPERLWVYRRRGAICLRCNTARIRYARLGRGHRSTYWCPACQSENG
mgnify:CR=1 FL=1